jgi:endonuclease YncB( thermonuclease family)
LIKHRRKAVVTAGEIGLVLLAGIFAGLAYSQAPASGPGLIGPVKAGASAAPLLAEPAIAGPVAAHRSSARTSHGDVFRQGGEKLRFAGDRPEPGTPTRGVSDPSTVRIVDGDTFHYGGEKIRIADIDTPELRGRCAYETQLAVRATRRMDQLLRQGPFELQSVGRDEDRYGRKLRVVTRGGHSLGDQLVAEGLARTWAGRREPWCA